MKKVVILIFALAILSGVFLGVFFKKTKKEAAQKILSLQQTTTPTIPTPAVGTPQTFYIPSLHITAQVESVGLDSHNRMDVPQNVYDVAWYNLGYKPGEKGSAVIDGHYDTQTGAPAVFYYIKDLTPGDRILVTDTNGKTYTFVVTENTTYPYNQLPLKEIFASNDKPRLNLITCSGVWDRSAHNYSTRDVVYAVEE